MERRTYASTISPKASITLFKEETRLDQPPSSTSISHALQASTSRVIFIDTIARTGSADESVLDIVLVQQDGGVQCLDGNTLEVRWMSPATAIAKDDTVSSTHERTLEFVHVTNAQVAAKGLLKFRKDLLSAVSAVENEDKDILVVVAKQAESRIMHVLALPSRVSGDFHTQAVQTLLSMKLPQHGAVQGTQTRYDLQVASGILYEMANGSIISYDVTNTLPVEVSQAHSEKFTSFLPLSKVVMMTSSKVSVNIINSRYNALQATLDLNALQDPQSATHKRKSPEAGSSKSFAECRLISHFARLEMVVAVAGNELLAFQIEAVQGPASKRHAGGLLMDSIGRGIASSTEDSSNAQLDVIRLRSMGAYLPGSETMSDTKWASVVKAPELYIRNRDVEKFEKVMARYFGIVRDETELEAWTKARNDNNVEGKPLPDWVWPESRSAYPRVDRRWVSFAIQKLLAVSDAAGVDNYMAGIKNNHIPVIITFDAPNVLNYLIETGHLTTSNVQAALRGTGRLGNDRSIPPGSIIRALVDIDPSMQALLSYLNSTFMPAEELLHAIHLLMESLDIFGREAVAVTSLLTNGENYEEPVNGTAEAQFEQEEAKAEAALLLAESHLADDSSIRGQALSIALAKLFSCSSTSVVRALQTTLPASEIVSLIDLLRFELARGSWTTRYLDANQIDTIEEDLGASDNGILLLSSLLNSCVDAIGAGGWLSGDAKLVNGDHFESEELIANLKLEVSAALEGIEEAAYLKGLVGEMVRFGEDIQGALPTKRSGRTADLRPQLIPTTGQAETKLPFGLKAEQQIKMLRVGAGGEVKKRSKRDIGMLKSKKVEKYSLERISV